MYTWYYDPSWWEAIGTVSAVIITLIFIMGSKLRNYLYSPNITASDPDISYNRPQSHTGTRGSILLSWKIHNKPRLLLFGGIAVNVITRFWFDARARRHIYHKCRSRRCHRYPGILFLLESKNLMRLCSWCILIRMIQGRQRRPV